MYRFHSIISKRFAFSISIVIIFLSLVSSSYAGRYKHVEVEGCANILSGRIDMARDKAISDALRRALEQAVGVMVEAESVVKNFELLNDRIYSQTSGYIKNYRIIGDRVEGGVLIVKIRATVAMKNLMKDLDAIGILIKRVGKPRLMLLISEKNMSFPERRGDIFSIGVVKDTLAKKFMEKGFDLVDSKVVLESIKDDPSITHDLNKRLTDDIALRLASEGEAEIVIIGQAIAKAGPTIMGTSIRSCQANFSARVISADSSEVIATFTTSAVAAHVNPVTGGTEALREAASKMAEKLIPQILAKWKSQVAGTRTVKLVVSGLSFNNLKYFKDFLRTHVRGLADIYERSYRNGINKLDLQVKSSAKEIAEELSNKVFRKRLIRITSLTGSVIRIRLVAR
nr:hypothetical protein [Desulfobacterales bacterium]